MGQSMPHGPLEQGAMNSTILLLWVSALGLLTGSSSPEESTELWGCGAACTGRLRTGSVMGFPVPFTTPFRHLGTTRLGAGPVSL